MMVGARLLQEISKPKLRALFLVFFIALLVPTLILVLQAYDRLKWEALYLNRNLAREIATRIDNHLSDVIGTEESRMFTDYGYVVVAGDPSANFLQPSPLSSYPVAADLPGLVGHFQVDPDGRFSTPLLPQQAEQARSYGVTPAELAGRRDLHDRIEQILSRNQLVQAEPVEDGSIGPEVADQKQDESTDDVASAAPAFYSRRSAEESKARDENQSLESAAPLPEMAADSNAGADSLQQSSEVRSLASRGQMVTQLAFDRLREDVNEQERQKKVAGPKGPVQLDDLSVSVGLSEAQQESEVVRLKSSVDRLARVARKEQSALPTRQLVTLSPGEEDADRGQFASGITLFESEVQPFDFSLLDSGHFVVYRQVWREGQRYIQGAIIDQEPFLSGAIEVYFSDTTLAEASDLIIGYYGNILSTLSATEIPTLSGSDDLSGTQLYRNRLSAPFDGLELIFTVTRLPAGPGATVLGWVASVLAVVLLAGTYLMYRLGLRLIEASQQQRDFVSSVSHELKTPLTSIRMYGEILREGWASEEKKKDYYEFIYDESERLTRLITNVLQLARMSRSELQIDSKPVSVDELMDGIRSKVASQIESAGFELNVSAIDTSGATQVLVDSDAFTQIMINLVDNAIKFTRKSPTRRIDLTAAQLPDGMVVFAVRDHGPGIAKDQLDKIFGLFYRAEDELTRETAGTGIGLALVHQLARSMGGRVEAKNSNPGAEFRVMFDAMR
jgi:signal transduction histidine kinase